MKTGNDVLIGEDCCNTCIYISTEEYDMQTQCCRRYPKKRVIPDVTEHWCGEFKSQIEYRVEKEKAELGTILDGIATVNKRIQQLTFAIERRI